MSTQSFADLGVSRAVVDALTKNGFSAPFKIQSAVLGDALSGRDVLARSPTGSGKTLAFGIPMVDGISAEARRPSGLVLAPTRELATQIVDELREIAHSRALRISAVYGGVGLLKQAETAARSHIIVATPGRLEDQLARGAFKLSNVKTLVIDEADRMLDMGFRPALDRIVALCPEQRQTMFFSATLDGEAGKAARRYTIDATFHEHGPAERRASVDVDHRFVEVTHDGRLDTLVEHLKAPRELALVFVRTKHGADKLVKKLDQHGILALAMHGNKTQRQREQALAKFEGFQVDTLVATDVAARGIDVSGISHVINFDPPHDSETYVHRVGRTGRAGATGVGITLVSPDQRKEISRMVGELGIDAGFSARTGIGAAGFRRAEMPAAKPEYQPARRPDARPARKPRTGSAPRGGHPGARNGHSGPQHETHGNASKRGGYGGRASADKRAGNDGHASSSKRGGPDGYTGPGKHAGSAGPQKSPQVSGPQGRGKQQQNRRQDSAPQGKQRNRAR